MHIPHPGKPRFLFSSVANAIVACTPWPQNQGMRVPKLLRKSPQRSIYIASPHLASKLVSLAIFDKSSRVYGVLTALDRVKLAKPGNLGDVYPSERSWRANLD